MTAPLQVTRARPTGSIARVGRTKRHVHCTLGVLAAALLFEFSRRPFVAGWNEPEGDIRTVRNYIEGFSVAHFEADGLAPLGNRLTGNPPLPGAPELLILGDSHVVAEGVRDEETMGAVVERLSRAAGCPMNVRQYGWAGGNAPAFLASAESVLSKRNPARVAVILNAYNVSVYALRGSKHWRMEVAADYSFRLIDLRAAPRGGWRSRVSRWAGRSALALALWRRFGLIEHRLAHERNFAENPTPGGSDSHLAEEAARIPRATVLGLKQAYGTRLLIVYVPELLGAGYYSADPVEQKVQHLCTEQSVAFLSVRDALAQDRIKRSRVSRGFHNTAPGFGHFNGVGHRIIGEQIWQYLDARAAHSIQ